MHVIGVCPCLLKNDEASLVHHKYTSLNTGMSSPKREAHHGVEKSWFFYNHKSPYTSIMVYVPLWDMEVLERVYYIHRQFRHHGEPVY